METWAPQYAQTTYSLCERNEHFYLAGKWLQRWVRFYGPLGSWDHCPISKSLFSELLVEKEKANSEEGSAQFARDLGAWALDQEINDRNCAWKPRNKSETKEYPEPYLYWDHRWDCRSCFHGPVFKATRQQGFDIFSPIPDRPKLRYHEPACGNDWPRWISKDWLDRSGAVPESKLRFDLYSYIPSGTTWVWNPNRAWSAICRMKRSSLLWEPDHDVAGGDGDALKEADFVEANSHDDDEFNGQERPVYTEGTGHIVKRGKHRDWIAEDFAQKDEEWEATRRRCEQALQEERAWSPLDPPENTITVKGARVNTSNRTYNLINFLIDWHNDNYDTLEQLARDYGLHDRDLKTLRRELEEFTMEPEERYAGMNQDQANDVVDGGVWALVNLDKPRWYKLDMDQHETYRQALDAVRQVAENEALKKGRVFGAGGQDNETMGENPLMTQALKAVNWRFQQAFLHRNVFVMDGRSPLVRAIAEVAWDEDTR